MEEHGGQSLLVVFGAKGSGKSPILKTLFGAKSFDQDGIQHYKEYTLDQVVTASSRSLRIYEFPTPGDPTKMPKTDQKSPVVLMMVVQITENRFGENSDFRSGIRNLNECKLIDVSKDNVIVVIVGSLPPNKEAQNRIKGVLKRVIQQEFYDGVTLKFIDELTNYKDVLLGEISRIL